MRTSLEQCIHHENQNRHRFLKNRYRHDENLQDQADNQSFLFESPLSNFYSRLVEKRGLTEGKSKGERKRQ